MFRYRYSFFSSAVSVLVQLCQDFSATQKPRWDDIAHLVLTSISSSPPHQSVNQPSPNRGFWPVTGRCLCPIVDGMFVGFHVMLQLEYFSGSVFWFWFLLFHVYHAVGSDILPVIYHSVLLLVVRVYVFTNSCCHLYL